MLPNPPRGREDEDDPEVDVPPRARTALGSVSGRTSPVEVM